MQLRKIQLSKPRDLAEFFDSKLELWLDGVSDPALAALNGFFRSQYQMRQEALPGPEDGGITEVEYATRSLYQFMGAEGNLVPEYERARQDAIDFSIGDEATAVRFQSEHGNRDPGKNAQEVMRRLKFEGENHQKLDYANRLKLYLQSGSSATISVIPNIKFIHHLSGSMSAPRDFGDPDFEMPLVRIRMMPFSSDIVQGLTGVLFSHDIQYETPVHQRIFQEILREDRTEYVGHSYFEHQESLKGTGTR